jgi:mono/diheme cytochrome c family protein
MLTHAWQDADAMQRETAIVCAVVTLGAFGGLVSTPAPVAAQMPPVLIESLAGADSFQAYCVPCHGASGHGDGPVASALRTRPADLTALAQQGGGTFPRNRVRDVVSGTERLVAAHGTADMPVWGPIFRAFESEPRARQRIESLLAYIESIQVPSTGVDDAGGRLFRTHCAICHGPSGRGNGVMAGQMRRTPPDLTQYTRRNGGVFPEALVYRIVEGGEVPSHGNREMPVWGDVFKRGASAADARARIEAIVRYLAGIQERGA